MPVRRTSSGGYRWGNQKTYYGAGARAKAEAQGRAIRASQANTRSPSTTVRHKAR